MRGTGQIGDAVRGRASDPRSGDQHRSDAHGGSWAARTRSSRRKASWCAASLPKAWSSSTATTPWSRSLKDASAAPVDLVRDRRERGRSRPRHRSRRRRSPHGDPECRRRVGEGARCRSPAGTTPTTPRLPRRSRAISAPRCPRSPRGWSSVVVTDMRMQVFDGVQRRHGHQRRVQCEPDVDARGASSALADIRTSGRRVAVLGDMAELGSLAELAHFRLGEQVARTRHRRARDRRRPGTTHRRRRARGGHGRGDGAPVRDRRRGLRGPGRSAEPRRRRAREGVAVMGLERVVEGILRPHV